MADQSLPPSYVMEYDPVNCILRATFHGDLTDAEMNAAFVRVQQFVASEGGCRAIADFSDATLTAVSIETIRRLAMEPALIPDQYVRVVVGRHDAVYGLARMYQILGAESRTQLHVARTLEEAYTILGVEAPDFSRRIME